jgi:hypothetical protein
MMDDERLIIKGLAYWLCQCGDCGVLYIVPEIVHISHREYGGFASCSNGHQWGWKTGEEQRRQDALRLERDRLKQDAARLEDELAEQRRRAEEAEKRITQEAAK